MELPRPSVTKTVKDMEKLGFVEKETTETDGRFVYIKTTRTGRDLVDKYVDEYLVIFRKSWRDYG